MNELEKQARYAYWRFSVWLAGYGTYDQIDKAVKKGELTLGQKWPVDKERET